MSCIGRPHTNWVARRQSFPTAFMKLQASRPRFAGHWRSASYRLSCRAFHTSILAHGFFVSFAHAASVTHSSACLLATVELT
ncbi:hypothetical protein LZ31DRAFT_102345 [Colletotrichum somersetense]|nr:hypothetical protein LZ31DRAFT_102345 [Colletotrichum somersetense]